jgi:hypothetical protein
MPTPPTPTGKGAASAAGKKGIGAWYAGHKPEALLGAAGIVVTLALYVRSKNAAAAASGSTTPATGSTSTVMPGTLAPDTGSYGNGGGDITGLESVLTGLGQQLTALQGQQATGSGTPATAPAPAPAAAQTYGQGIIDTAQGEMVWLGVTGAGGSTAQDYQVGGGAPVFFGNAGALSQGGTSQAGVDVYTPVAYENLVSQKAG